MEIVMAYHSQEKYAQAKRTLVGLLSQPDNEARQQSRDQDLPDELSAWLHSVQSEGWTRKDVHDLILAIYKNEANTLSEEALENLGEIETGVIGYCAPSYIIKFPGDPTDPTELAAHVRGEHWR